MYISFPTTNVILRSFLSGAAMCVALWSLLGAWEVPLPRDVGHGLVRASCQLVWRAGAVESQLCGYSMLLKTLFYGVSQGPSQELLLKTNLCHPAGTLLGLSHKTRTVPDTA